MNSKFLASIIIILAVSLTAISTALIIPVTAQNASNQDNVIQQPFYRQSHDLDVFIIRDLNTNVICSETNLTPTATWEPYHRHDKLIYSWSESSIEDASEYPPGHLSAVNGNSYTPFHIINGRVDGPGNYFTMIVTIDDNRNKICTGGDNLFTMDVVGKCDGTMFEGISREPGGFNVTYYEPFKVTCIP